MTPWKDLERTVAKKFSGYRIPRGGDFSESLPDVIADVSKTFPLLSKGPSAFSIECKYRQNQPWINKYKRIKAERFSESDFCILKIPVKNVGGMDDNICMMPVDYVFNYFAMENPAKTATLREDLPDYIVDYCTQSYMYAIDPEYRMRVHLYYWKLAKESSKKTFERFIPIVVLGQRNDKVRLAIFFESEFTRI